MHPFSRTYQFKSDLFCIRETLAQIMSDIEEIAPQADSVGTMEIVLAEVLNNISEHAYEGAPNGKITAKLEHHKAILTCEIWDKGKAMPHGAAPTGKTAEVDVDTDALPEGGFGWFLIREMTLDLVYGREAEQNRLRFRLPLE